ncbi:MAG: GGDEF domain-containing protein [Tepidisphaeraceae bacterium]
MGDYAVFGIIAAGMFVTALPVGWFYLHRQALRLRNSPVRLAHLISNIHAGKAPIEELAEVRGLLAPVAEEVQNLLREIRAQKQTIASLDQECQVRIENRTSALQRLVESLRHQANCDVLTGLHNRRLLDQLLPQLVRQCLADAAPLSILMLDVQNLRELNDAQLPGAGDSLLHELGQIIHSSLRQNDSAFRYGGDQFVVIFPGCDSRSAEAVGRRLNSLVRNMPGVHKAKTRPCLDVGTCTLSELRNPTAENLIRGALESLAAVKAALRSEIPAADKRMVG